MFWCVLKGVGYNLAKSSWCKFGSKSGMDSSFVGPEEHMIRGMVFKKSNTKLCV